MTMAKVVFALQVVSGLAWLTLAAYLIPRIVGAWKQGASHVTLLSARNGILAWLMFGFCARWLVWRDAVRVMGQAELICWAALYALSAFCAFWFFMNALQNRGR